jgi:hypothetical protein
VINLFSYFLILSVVFFVGFVILISPVWSLSMLTVAALSAVCDCRAVD